MPSNSAEYMKEWRQTPSGQAALESQRKRAKARRLAIQDLIHKHELEFEILLVARVREVLKSPD